MYEPEEEDEDLAEAEATAASSSPKAGSQSPQRKGVPEGEQRWVYCVDWDGPRGRLNGGHTIPFCLERSIWEWDDENDIIKNGQSSAL